MCDPDPGKNKTSGEMFQEDIEEMFSLPEPDEKDGEEEDKEKEPTDDADGEDRQGR